MPRVGIVDNFLNQRDHDTLLSFVLENRAQFQNSQVYEQGRLSVESNHRQGLKLRVQNLEILRPFHIQLKAKQQFLFEQVGMRSEAVVRYESELAAYNDGGFFHEHIDTLTASIRTEQGARQARALSLVYYFFRQPKAFSGGQLRVWGFSDGENRPHIDVSPADNILVAFPSFAIHEVLPISCPSKNFNDSRFAVNCWLHCNI